MSTRFRDRYGPYALVTGAARGLGAELARQLAARGLDLVLVDVLEEELAARARELSARVRVTSVVLDLARPDLLEALAPALEGIELGLLVCNAARVRIAPFLEQELEAHLELLAVNCRAPLLLVRALAPRLVARGRGGIILLSSCSALQGTPLVAHYAASKAYNLLLGESLWAELRERGVDVLVIAPGSTETPGFLLEGPDRRSLAGRLLMPVEPTVREALDALGRQPTIIPGRRNRLGVGLLSRLLPRSLAIGVMGQNLRALFRR